MKKVGIYFGTFDPIHEGHLALAAAAAQECDLEKVFFLIEPRPRRKQGVKALEHRSAMVRLAIKHEPRFGSILLEQQRFTPLDTLPLLMERFKGAELYLIMGDDTLSHFGDWPHVEELMRQVRFIIGLRTHEKAEVERRLDTVQRTRALVMDYQILSTDLPACSSRAIRISVRRGHKPRDLPLVVYAYIKQEGLYASVESGSGSGISS
ncbi:MAG TPA: adenylyltransferase/cytidyltransferase family protein [Verrucomicrobiae bacterium]|nr:adenylyltransferase/cytidyltransferase family protein [Verrucomicrobiae bacterium]